MPVLLISRSPPQTHYQSSKYSAKPYRPRYSPRYLQSTTHQDQSSVYSAVQCRPSISSLFNPQSTAEPVPVLRLLYIPTRTQYQSTVYSAVRCRRSTCLHYTLQSIIDLAPILSTVHCRQYQSSLHSINRTGSMAEVDCIWSVLYSVGPVRGSDGQYRIRSVGKGTVVVCRVSVGLVLGQYMTVGYQ